MCRYILFIILILLSINAFARDAYQWQGANINSLMKQWGAPDIHIKRKNGSSILIYHIETYRAGVPLQGSPAVGVNVSASGKPVIVTSPYPNPTINQSVSLYCDIEFTANSQGVIISIKMRGSGC